MQTHHRSRTLATLLFVVALATAAAPTARAATAPFALIVVPDTQNYTDFSDINNTYNLGQMRWIRDNMTSLNIKFVMHLGDHQNPGNPYRARTDNIYEPDLTRPVGNVADKQTVWDRADAAIQVLDNNNIPYSLVRGTTTTSTTTRRSSRGFTSRPSGPAGTPPTPSTTSRETKPTAALRRS